MAGRSSGERRLDPPLYSVTPALRKSGEYFGPASGKNRHKTGPGGLTSGRVIRSNRATCPGGGIGRRAGFRCQWLNGREGSSPFLGTTPFNLIFARGCAAKPDPLERKAATLV